MYIDNLRIVNDDLDDVPMSADLELDGDVDGNDFLLIQQSDPSLIGLWKDQFGLGAAGGAAAVPEPAGWTLTLLTTAMLMKKRQVLRR